MIRPNTGDRPKPRLVSTPAPNQDPADVATSDSSAVRLKSFVERIEYIEAEIAALNADKKEIYAEAKGVGFEVKPMKEVMRKRRMDVQARREHDEIVDLYERALGMKV